MLDLFVAAAALLFLDQLSKRIVRRRRVRGMKCTCTGHRSRVGLVLIWFLALACATILHASSATFQSHLSMLGVGAALGGAAGNLSDVLRRRAIVDFIDLGWWPVFNVADIGIVAGLVAAFLPLV